MNTQRGFGLIELIMILIIVILVGFLAWAIIHDAKQPLDQKGYSTQSLKNVQPLSDCIYINLDGMRIIRCPNSSTSTQWTASSGKTTTTHNAMVIE